MIITINCIDYICYCLFSSLMFYIISSKLHNIHILLLLSLELVSAIYAIEVLSFLMFNEKNRK